ncbi:MAG: MaoC family dehydratase [Candidatus Helarchaeota archaeon]
MVEKIEYSELENNVGREYGWSDWVEVTQDKINMFADATGDHQWIHVDVEAAKKGPFGQTIAHGYWTLSIIPAVSVQIRQFLGIGMALNYGVNKVRFPTPVPVGKRIRAKATLNAVKPIDKPSPGKQIEETFEIWVEGANKPACVAETISRLYPK